MGVLGYKDFGMGGLGDWGIGGLGDRGISGLGDFKVKDLGVGDFQPQGLRYSYMNIGLALLSEGLPLKYLHPMAWGYFLTYAWNLADELYKRVKH